MYAHALLLTKLQCNIQTNVCFGSVKYENLPSNENFMNFSPNSAVIIGKVCGMWQGDFDKVVNWYQD